MSLLLYYKLYITLIAVYSKGLTIYQLSLQLCYNIYIPLIAVYVEA